jgi:hypothetical protein
MFFMCACAEEAPDCDFFVEGACVITNSFPVDAEMITKEFRAIELEFNEVSEFQGNPLLLGLLAEEHELQIEWVAYPGPFFWSVEDNDWMPARGVYSEPNGQPTIQLRYPWKPMAPPVNEGAACQEKYYVLGHELLHFIDYHYLQATGGHKIMLNDNLSLFLSFECPSIEREIYFYTMDECDFHP